MNVQRFSIDEFNRDYSKIFNAQYIDMNAIADVIYVPPSTHIEDPIEINALHTLVVIDEGASVVIRDMQNIMHEKRLYCYVKSQASLQLQCLYTQGVTYDEAHIVCITEANAICEINFLCMNAIKSEYTITCIASGANASMQVRGAYLLKEQESTSFYSSQKQYAQHTTSTLDIRGIVSDKSSALFKGLILIESQAQYAYASQINKNILLGAQACVQSIPAIEVLTNDVQCSHGSAMGQLDVEQIWYMQSRGITEKDATRILLEGFLSDLFSNSAMIMASEQYLSQVR
jgi:Fe-S cluster assembly protein SufD